MESGNSQDRNVLKWFNEVYEMRIESRTEFCDEIVTQPAEFSCIIITNLLTQQSH
jgi:hypothetical protein